MPRSETHKIRVANSEFDNIEQAIKALDRFLLKSGTYTDWKRKEYFETKSEIRRRKHRSNRRAKKK